MKIISRTILGALLATAALAVPAQPQDMQAVMDAAFAKGLARPFMLEFPKGGDLHNHVEGAIYAETWLAWAAEDGLCADKTDPRLIDPAPATTCADGLVPAAEAVRQPVLRNRLIDALSTRDFAPADGWSGSDQFFGAFDRIAVRPYRFGDMLATLARRAASQDLLYLELLKTLRFGDILRSTAAIGDLPEDPEQAIDALMATSFGSALPEILAATRREIAEAMARKDLLLGCGGAQPEPGCDVEIRLLYQVLREWSPATVLAQMITGWHMIEDDPMVVGINMVQPEDGHIALTDYRRHMAFLAALHDTRGEVPVSLHAGELSFGLVPPPDLRFHVQLAIEQGRARRIGHGVAIPFETDATGLMRRMAEQPVPIEINITSNDVILGISGQDHPAPLYRAMGIPLIYTTDDAGVSRHDLTGEYVRAVRDLGADYAHMKQASRDSLRYAFIEGDALQDSPQCWMAARRAELPSPSCRDLLARSPKARLQVRLEAAFRRFETNWAAKHSQP